MVLTDAADHGPAAGGRARRSGYRHHHPGPAPRCFAGAVDERRRDLAEFLRSRREAVGPDDVGLPPGARRRTPGLRREEVALLAGVSVTWYTWLEQGRAINASRDVLDALARTLLLDDVEHAHLLALADPVEDPAPGADGPATPPPDVLVRLLDALDPTPAYVLGPRWEYLAWNDAQDRLFPGVERLDGVERNLLWIVLVDPTARALIVGWEGEAAHMVRQFRADTATRRDDPVVVELVDRLRRASEPFAGWWDAHDVAGPRTRLRAYDHPVAGRLTFEYAQHVPLEWPELRIVTQLGLPDDDSVERLAAG